MLYAASLCLAVVLGLVFCFSKRTLVQVGKLQKFFGALLILFAAHLLILNMDLVFGNFTDSYLQHLLVLADLLVMVFCTVGVIRSVFRHEPQAQPAREESIPDMREESIPDMGQETSENSLPDESGQEEDNESEAVEKLESPNVYDYLFFQKVEALMVNEKLFCEQDISRETVAHAIGTNRTYLARSIKSATGKTFSEYINDLRTVYAAKLLSTTDEPLDMIGTLVGFRSKSAYYRAFSAAYECSPSEYRKKSVIQQSEEK